MNQFKKANRPANVSATRTTTTHTIKPVEKQEIDAAIQNLVNWVNQDPKKAAKIFEGWLDGRGASKKTRPKKTAA